MEKRLWSSMEGRRQQGKWLLRREDFEGHPVGDSFKSMLTALGRVARSKHQRELLSREGESRQQAATTSTGAPREGNTVERRGGSVKFVLRKKKATEETLSWEDVQRRCRLGKEIVEEGNGVADETGDKEWRVREEKSRGNKLVPGNPARVGGKRKATEETLSWRDVQRCRLLGKEVVEEGTGFAAESSDEEWSLREEKSRGTRRNVGLNTKAGEGSSNRSKASLPAPSNPPADMPQEFKDQIDRLGGKEVKLVIEKEPSRTDLDRHICRVSIPKNQVRDLSFLRDEENRAVAAAKALDVMVIGPKQSQVLKFALVEMGSRNKVKPSLIYNLRSGWNNFASENELKAGNKIQIWSFRVDSDDHRDRLCFALVKLDNKRGDCGVDNNNGGSPSSVPDGSKSAPGSTSTPKKEDDSLCP